MSTRVYLTFDVEDTINDSSFLALQKVLELLKKEKLKGTFFITGAVAEKLNSFKDVLSALSEHDIGYHSTSHSVRPTIFEYTDIPDYREAVKNALKRETSHVDALTGEAKGEGGIIALRELFPHKRIVSFRAPGFCWSPPHLEALKTVGIEYDFSANLSSRKVCYNGITFYPYPLVIMPPEGKMLNFSIYRYLFRRILLHKTVVIAMHPHSLLNAEPWDSIYWHGNPAELTETLKKSEKDSKYCTSLFKKFLKRLNLLHRIGMIKVSSTLESSSKAFHIDRNAVFRCYQTAIDWPIRYFNYHPKYLYGHFINFFNYESYLKEFP